MKLEACKLRNDSREKFYHEIIPNFCSSAISFLPTENNFYFENVFCFDKNTIGGKTWK